MIDGKEVVRKAVGADEMMQAFFYKHLVPADDLTFVPAETLRFRDAGGPPGRRRQAGGNRPREAPAVFQSPMAVLSEQPVKIPAGGTAEVQVRMPWGRRGQIQVELSDPPEGIAVDRMSSIDQAVLALVLPRRRRTRPSRG